MSDVKVTESNVTNGKAIIALVFGILSIVTVLIPILGLILGIVGLSFGIMGLQEIKRLGQNGKKLTISGIVCSCLGILLPFTLAVIGYMVFMNAGTITAL